MQPLLSEIFVIQLSCKQLLQEQSQLCKVYVGDASYCINGKKAKLYNFKLSGSHIFS